MTQGRMLAEWAGFETVDLAEIVATADLRTRVDRKYLLDLDALTAVLGDLPEGLRVLDIDGRRSFDYESVYFDTERLRCFHDHAHGRRRRFKVRSRSYLDSGECLLEVKRSGARGETVKTRYAHALVDRYALRGPATAAVQAQVPVDLATLAPRVVTTYRRSTVLDDLGESRFTVDVDLGFAAGERQSTAPAGLVLVETKTPGAPARLDRALWRRGLRPLSISKYCLGAAILDPTLPASAWNRPLRRHFGWRPEPRR